MIAFLNKSENSDNLFHLRKKLMPSVRHWRHTRSASVHLPNGKKVLGSGHSLLMISLHSSRFSMQSLNQRYSPERSLVSPLRQNVLFDEIFVTQSSSDASPIQDGSQLPGFDINFILLLSSSTIDMTPFHSSQHVDANLI